VITVLAIVSGPVVYAAIDTVFTAAYLIGFWVWRGQTPGKMLFGLRIVTRNYKPVPMGDAILRYFAYIFAPLTLFIIFLWIASDTYRQGLHDKLAGTYVIK
jgi:uncharacterized RDD family membrane protein YckC